MRLDVVPVPALLIDLSGQVCIVVDVLRASSTIVTMLERGAQEVLLAPTIEEARSLHQELPRYLLCGEEGGLPPSGFDYGNSPSEFSALDLKGQRAILHQQRHQGDPGGRGCAAGAGRLSTQCYRRGLGGLEGGDSTRAGYRRRLRR